MLAAVTAMAVGEAGAATPTAVVVIPAGAADKLVALNVNGPPKEPVVILLTATVGVLAALVNVQVNLAEGFKFATGIVKTLPESVPNGPGGLRDTAVLLSTHAAVVKVKLLFTASVMVTAVVVVVTVTGEGATGAAVPAVVVVIPLIDPVRLVAEKVNGPLAAPVVIFCTATVGIAGLAILLNVQVIWALARTLAAGTVKTVPANTPKVPTGFPDAAALASVHEAELIEKFAANASVIVTAVPLALTVIGA